jgi:DNA-directed RNA polymerase specialized sigma24 family protein
MPRVRGARRRAVVVVRPKRPGGDTGRPVRPAAERTLRAVYASHYRQLVRTAALLIGDVPSAEDVVQAAFAAVWRQACCEYSAQALHCLWREVVRRARRCQLIRDRMTPDQRPARGLPGTHALAALQALPLRVREAAVLCYVAGLPIAEIAAVTGASARAVQDALRQASAALTGPASLDADPAAPPPASGHISGSGPRPDRPGAPASG